MSEPLWPFFVCVVSTLVVLYPDPLGLFVVVYDSDICCLYQIFDPLIVEPLVRLGFFTGSLGVILFILTIILEF